MSRPVGCRFAEIESGPAQGSTGSVFSDPVASQAVAAHNAQGPMSYERKDGFYRLAKREGFRSRAAYKLLELSRRHRLLRPGDHVVDLGAWPGGWLQVAAMLVGPSGRVIGVDLVPIDPLPDPVVAIVTGDVRSHGVEQEIFRLSGGRVDVVLSDMAPKLTGVRATDAVRSAELFSAACRLARRLLSPGGRFLAKAFTGPETDAIIATLRGSFLRVKRTSPEASRAGSSEIYIVGLGFRGSTDRTCE